MTQTSFFNAQSIELSVLAEQIGATMSDGVDGALVISSAAPIEDAQEGDITFLDNAKYLSQAKTTQASAVICSEKHALEVAEGVAILIHDKPYKAYGEALGLLFPEAMRPVLITGETGISQRAFIGEGCEIEDGAVVEAGAVVGPGACIGSGSHIHANATIGSNVKIGRNTSICANASVSNALIGNNVTLHCGVRVGCDGFGFAMGPGGHKKLPQIGRVIIQDHVEVGANSTIDRGANRDTVIGEGTKIDNLVQIGHNVVIGRHCVIVGLSGISGSATLGDFVVVAGQAGIVGHIKLGDGAQVGGGSGVHNSVAPGERVMGYPAIPANQWMREAARILRDARNKAKGKKGGEK